jgi:hypothetical protein
MKIESEIERIIRRMREQDRADSEAYWKIARGSYDESDRALKFAVWAAL